ncbi:MAG UNVERIFIED_CONTAM: hypothetical protein LVR29_03285 [Microcystis novacekii LVE1205-3]
MAFARRFGELTKAHPTVPGYLTDYPEIFDLDYRRHHAYTDLWHTDVTFVERPPLRLDFTCGYYSAIWRGYDVG